MSEKELPKGGNSHKEVTQIVVKEICIIYFITIIN